MYIYQLEKWPEFYWQDKQIINLLSEVRHLQGVLLGKMENVGFDLKKEATLKILTTDVIKTSQIEGEELNREMVRSSVAQRLGIEIVESITNTREVDGIVDITIDAVNNYGKFLTKERLFDWHSALFPIGRSGMHKINVGKWRDNSKGPMQFVSGAIGKEKIHFEAPDFKVLDSEISKFIKWYNTSNKVDGLIKAAISHLWFITLHPFDDGNGRIARAITDMSLAKLEDSNMRFYSMSAQIQKTRKQYYDILEQTQKESLDITNWLEWFLTCLKEAIMSSDEILGLVLNKAKFWPSHNDKLLNVRHKKIINLLLDGFKGKLTSSKWAKITKCSQDTALRDIKVLLEYNILIKEEAGGRSTNYILQR